MTATEKLISSKSNSSSNSIDNNSIDVHGPDPGVAKCDPACEKIVRIFSLNTGYSVGPTVECLCLYSYLLSRNPTFFLQHSTLLANNTVRCLYVSRKKKVGQRLQNHTYKKFVYLVLLTAPPTGSCRIPTENTLENYFITNRSIPQKLDYG